MTEVKCKCGSTNYRTEQAGPHIKAVCNDCNSYIKFLPQGADGNTIMYFGKHKGKKLSDIPLDYWHFMIEENLLSGSLKQYANNLLHEAK